MNNADSLARFRADPSKVRVAIRRDSLLGWVATVSCIMGMGTFESCSAFPERAVDGALRQADLAGMEGVDLGMEWTYEHPFGRLGLEARR